MAKVELSQEHVYVPGKAKKRSRIALFFLVIFMATGLWALAQEGVFESGMSELKNVKQVYLEQKNKVGE